MGYLAARFRAALWWLLPLAALSATVGWETDWGRGFDKRPEPAAAMTPQPVVASLLPEYQIAGGPAARTEMVERTLFNPTRRPAPAAAQEGAAARLKRGQFALTGTMVVDGKSTAFLRELAGNKARRVRAGERINGLLVADVKPDRVTFTMGEESEELFLKVATNPRPTAPTVAAAPPGPVLAPPPPALGAATAAAQPAPPGARDAGQTLAERRRAARAAAAAAGGGGGAPAPDGAASSAIPGAQPPAAAAGAPTPGAPDPRWGDIYKNYQRRQQ